MASSTKKIKLESTTVKSELESRSGSCAVDEPDAQGYTPLHRIFTKTKISKQDEGTMKMLLELGADIHTKANNGSGIFHSAVKHNVPAKFLQFFVNLSYPKAPETNIEHKIHNKERDVFSADINEVDNEGFAPIHWTVMSKTPRDDDDNNKALLKLLLRQSAVDANLKTNDGSTALHLAVKNGRSVDITGDIIKAGTKIEAVDSNGYTALQYTYITNGSYQKVFEFENIAMLLVKSGARFDCLDKENYTPLLVAALNKKTDLVLAMMAAVKGIEDLEYAIPDKYNEGLSNKGYTALHLAAKNSDLNMVEALIRGGAFVNALTSKNQNALHIILENKNNTGASISISKVLIDSDINIDAIYGNETPLHMALDKSEEITRYLIQKAANVNIKNEKGETILLHAIQSNKHEIVKLLLHR